MVAQAGRPNRSQRGQVIAVILVAAVVIGIAAFVSLRNGGDASAESGLEEGQEFVDVRRGDLVNQISSSGSIVFPNREQLSFGTAGTVSEFLVDEGDRVREGQELARLDDETIANLNRAQAKAQVDLQKAQDALADAMAPASDLDAAAAHAAAAKAELALQQANESLSDVEDPFTQSEIEDAQHAQRVALAALAGEEADLAYQSEQQASRVQAAQDALDDARDEYQRGVSNYFGMTLTEANYASTPAEYLAAQGVDLATFFSGEQLEAAVTTLLPLEPAPGDALDDPATPWDEFTQYRWIALYPGAVYGDCTGIAVAREDLCVLQDLDALYAKVDLAQEGVSAAENAAAKAATSAQKAVDQAMAQVDGANDKLDMVLENADSLEVLVKRRELELAEAKLAEAQETVAELAAAPDALAVALLEAEITAAEATLAGAGYRLGLVTITAPFSGVVDALLVEAGRTVNANAPVVEIVDPSVVQLDARLDEIDVLAVREGAEAIVALDGLPNAGLPGQVVSIGQSGNNQQGVVTYPVSISVSTPPFLQLVEGLSATASIILQQELDVLLIPTAAIAGSFIEPTVLVSLGGDVTEQSVELGITDGFWTVVVSGLDEGDTLVSSGGGAQFSAFGGRAPSFGLGGLGAGARGQGAGARRRGLGAGARGG